MSKSNLLLIAVFTVVPMILNAQSLGKAPLDHSVYDDWKDVMSTSISNDGNWIEYEINPQKGDGIQYLYDIEKDLTDSIVRGKNARISANSNFMVFKIYPQEDTVRKAKLDEVKKDKMPKDSLGIFLFSDRSLIKVERVKSFSIADEESDWIVYHCEKELPVKDTAAKDTTKTEIEKKDKKKKKHKQKGTKLVAFNPITKDKFEWENVSSFSFSDNGKSLGFIINKLDSIDTTFVKVFDTQSQKEVDLYTGQGTSKQINSDKNGTQFSYMVSEDTTDIKVYSLYYWSPKSANKLIIDTLTSGMPENYCLNEHSKPYFSDNGKMLFFKTSQIPIEEVEDSLLDEEKAKLDVWHWQDKDLQPKQLLNLKKDLKKGYLAVYHIEKRNMVQLADEMMDHINVNTKREKPIALGYTSDKYAIWEQWETPSYKDIYLVDLISGKSELVFEKHQYPVHLSPNGNTIVYYEVQDSNYYLYHYISKKTIPLTKDLDINFYNERHDMPMEPYPYEILSWTEDERHVLIYDKYDIWKFDVSGKSKPENITMGLGRANKTRYRYVWLDNDARHVKLDKVLLSAFNEETKQHGFYTFNYSKEVKLQQLVLENFRYNTPVKAKNADKLIWRKESVSVYPDLWVSDMNLKQAKQITNANPQQDDYLWATVELIKWKSFNGDTLQGLLFKPEDFHPTNKYPVIVYFYEKYSDHLFRHWTPRPSRSTINPTYYASNGYIVFIPDINYYDGYPGQSAYDAIVSGTIELSKKRYVDSENIGIQGQSWGGYQVAYLITRTDMYKCGMAGAPVSNMTSAYGGIRWGSGMSRMFQYEVTQSRIAATLWEKPHLYIENSPVFHANKVNTPLLIMHNDNDGAVPWYQGIEMFVALRRLNKPVWMLTYNNEAHNLKGRANCKDLTIRMQQFFDFYLKELPAPEWLINGVPATQKGKDYGLDLIEE